MFKKILVSIVILGLILPVGAVMAGDNSKGGKPTATPVPPTEPPVPTETPDTGSLYGDLYVILRDENGLPILDHVVLEAPETGENPGATVDVYCIQPISAVTASTTIATWDGSLTIDAFAGEPFALPSYFDIAGDLVECELTEDMATWVQAVDFGRLNLGRAPDSVINHAFDEAINKMNIATAFDLDPAGRLMLLIDGEWFTIDAPAENLALYIKMMNDGHWITVDTTPNEPGGGKGGGGGGGGGRPEGDGPSTEPRPVLNCFDDENNNKLDGVGLGGLCNPARNNQSLSNQEMLVAASLLAGAADKTGTMTLDKVVYINAIYGIEGVDFSSYTQNRGETYGANGRRTSGGCGAGVIWVLQPELDGANNVVPNHYVVECVNIMNKVHFNDYHESYTMPETMEFDYLDNIRGFAQSADDALQVLEYIHNYKVPEDLYAGE